ncbi:MAG: cell division FtsA domain-containing protein [Eubacterium sp.]|nr:cell division FtsA domain-containing protein [Eubacterium sp.]
MDNNYEGYVFGLDIGTRSIVGTVGYRVGVDRFVVVAQESIEHTTRAVIDGQIHDIETVSRTIVEVKTALEKRLQQTLSEVSIAAAGRVLKTREVHVEMEFPEETKVTTDHLRSMEMTGVEKAYEEIREDVDHKEKKFFCVGYSPARYFLNGYQMDMLEQHPAKSIAMDLIATFLPDEVVEGLYAAVESAGLHVASLTLEPIAAINVAIPEKFRLLNIALVDVGAGTSDLSIVKDGSIIAYGMIPLAGDELSEAIAREYLTDFETAESIKRKTAKRKIATFKNIFGDSLRATREDVLAITDGAVTYITKKIAEKIVELNGGKSVSAVFVVGGGGLQEGFTEKLAGHLGLPTERVAVRGADVLTNIDFPGEECRKDSMMVTPIGICLSAYEQSNNFIHVTVNDQPVKLYDNGKVTVLDACLTSGFKKENLFPIKGESLYYTVNGEKREVKGDSGEVVMVRKNRKEVSLNDPVFENDSISLKPSTKGAKGAIILGQIAECREEITVKLYGRDVICPKRVEVNGVPESSTYEVKDDDDVQVYDFHPVSFILDFAGYEKVDKVLLNGRETSLNARVVNGDVIDEINVEPVVSYADTKPEKKSKPKPTPKQEAKQGTKPEPEKPAAKPVDDGPKKHTSLEEAMAEDPLLMPIKPLPDWMEDVPFDTAKLGQDGKIIPGLNDRLYGYSYEEPMTTAQAADQEILDRIDGIKPAVEPPKPAGKPTHITVNGEDITIPAKAKGAIFVDVFDVYPFDMSKVGGSRLITRINGVDKNFTDALKDGDAVEIYWQK